MIKPQYLPSPVSISSLFAVQSIAVALVFVATLLPAPLHAQQFGGVLAVGDDEVFVGESANGSLPGIVYVYRKDDGGTWTERMQLVSSGDDQAPDGFGRVLATDGEMLLVGAPMYAASAGAVLVFHKDTSGDWIRTAHLAPADLREGDSFGTALSLSGNLLAISSAGGENESGSVYVFKRDATGSWVQGARLVGSESAVSDSVASDRFGATLHLDGDLLLVGAPAHNDNTGAAYAFRYNSDSSAWTEETKLVPAGQAAGSRFGSSFGLMDGLVLIGAPAYGDREGAVFAFEYDSDEQEWNQQARLAAFDAQRFAQFGSSIAFDGQHLWIGSPGDNRRVGAVYGLERDDEGGWKAAVKLTTGKLEGRVSFGGAMAGRGNLAVVGATGLDRGQGAAIIFERDDEGTSWEERNVVINEMKGFPAITGGEEPCTDDKVAAFSCSNVDVASFLPIKDIGGSRASMVNDIWGWTDPVTDKEYALVGRSDGTSFVDIADPFNPIYVGDLPKTEGAQSSSWRDMKVYKDHVFIVSDGANNHGMQVFDLTQLRDVDSPPVTFEATAFYDKIHSAHNIVINEETGFAYSVGSSSGGETCGGGLHMINIQDPTNPTFAGCFADITTGRRGTGYSHDAQCVNYHGPDADYVGKELCFGANETALSVADVTDKEDPVAISSAVYPKVAYAHQGWLSEDHRYFYMNDEGDEPQGLVDGTRTLVWDLQDLDDPVLAHEHIAETTTTDHNLYIRGDLMYQSNYGSGLRILDISQRENPVEVGFFDTTPFGGGGSWSNYPYFKSGYVVVTSMGEGLFVVRGKNAEL